MSIDDVHEAVMLTVVSIGLLVAVAEVIVRLTPTKKDDGAVKRLGARIDRLMDMMRVPNKGKPPGPDDSV